MNIMGNTNKQKFEIGDYIKLKSDPTQIFKVLGETDTHVGATNRDGISKLIDITNVELCDKDDFEDTPIFVDPKDLDEQREI